MFSTLSNIFKVSDLRNRILFTLGILIVYRLGAFIPVPNINPDALQSLTSQGDVFSLLNTFSGGALSQFSIFAMGIMPYITASIIVQLLTMDVIPKFTEWAKEGENGRRKLAQITRYGTIILGLIQAVGLSIGFNRMANMSLIQTDDNGAIPFSTYAMIAIVLTAGTAFLMWLGEQINEYGIGNGISIIIFAGIVAGLPSGAYQIYTTLFQAESSDTLFLRSAQAVLIVVGIILLVTGIIFVQQGVRKITVQYTKRVVGRKMYGGQTQHLPLKVNAAGVIPVIFALSLIMFPITIASFFVDQSGTGVARWIMDNLNYDKPLGMVLYVIFIIAFTFFYTFVQINPVQMAEQMKNNGGYILGIRPGKPTSTYLTKVLVRITLAGALFLAIISIMPVFVSTWLGLPPAVTIGGTSLLIVIGVALETMKQVESQLIKRHYKGFIDK